MTDSEHTPAPRVEDLPIGFYLENGPLIDYYADPEELAAIREADQLEPIDPVELQTWLDGLSPQERAFVESNKVSVEQRKAASQDIHQKLIRSLPELYKARLPAQLEHKLDGMEYGLGFNQSAASTIAEAQEYLEEYGGVDFTNYGLQHRFLMYDHAMGEGILGVDNPAGIAGAIERGYAGVPGIGRFVAAFPVVHPENRYNDEQLSTDIHMRPHDLLPADAIVINEKAGRQRVAFNSKYITGFIDGSGDFWVNTGFMETPEVRFQPSGSEPPIESHWL